MTSCEHYYCTECLRDLIVTNINEGKVGNIICAESECRKALNDIDVKNVGLEQELMEKY